MTFTQFCMHSVCIVLTVVVICTINAVFTGLRCQCIIRVCHSTTGGSVQHLVKHYLFTE